MAQKSEASCMMTLNMRIEIEAMTKALTWLVRQDNTQREWW